MVGRVALVKKLLCLHAKLTVEAPVAHARLLPDGGVFVQQAILQDLEHNRRVLLQNSDTPKLIRIVERMETGSLVRVVVLLLQSVAH